MSKPVMKLELGPRFSNYKHISPICTVSVRQPARNWWPIQLEIEENVIKGYLKGVDRVKVIREENGTLWACKRLHLRPEGGKSGSSHRTKWEVWVLRSD